MHASLNTRHVVPKDRPPACGATAVRRWRDLALRVTTLASVQEPPLHHPIKFHGKAIMDCRHNISLWYLRQYKDLVCQTVNAFLKRRPCPQPSPFDRVRLLGVSTSAALAMLLCASTISFGASQNSFKDGGVICESANGSGPAFLYQTSNGDAFTLGIIVQKDGSHTGRRVDVSSTEIVQLCSKGYGVALVPASFANEGVKSAFGLVDIRKYVPPTWSLQPTFSIYKAYIPGYGYRIYGNFWIPQTMPEGHSAQWSAMNVTTADFAAATDSSHFVHSLLTYSDPGDNLDTSRSGQGFILGRFGVGAVPTGFACGNWGLSYASAIETWGNYQEGKVHWMTSEGNPSGVPSSQLAWPNTCSPQLQDGVAYGFLTNTAQTRWINYQLYYANQPYPFYSSPAFYAGASNGASPNFVYGYAGAAYWVATGPVLDTNTWALNFSGAGGGTF